MAWDGEAAGSIARGAGEERLLGADGPARPAQQRTDRAANPSGEVAASRGPALALDDLKRQRRLDFRVPPRLPAQEPRLHGDGHVQRPLVQQVLRDPRRRDVRARLPRLAPDGIRVERAEEQHPALVDDVDPREDGLAIVGIECETKSTVRPDWP